MTEREPSEPPPPPPPSTPTDEGPSAPVDEVIFLPGGLDGVGASIDYDDPPRGRPPRR